MLDLKGYGWSILVDGTLITIQVSLLSLVLAVTLGILAALAKLSSWRGARALAGAYTTLVRGVPDLVLMLLLYFGGQVFVNWLAPQLGFEDFIDINPFMAGVLTIGFILGAYMTETFRGAILAIPRGQLEAASAYGMSGGTAFRRILFPQMVRLALPGFGNNWLVLLKTTAIVSVIGLDDMVRKAALAAGATREPFTFYAVVALDYLALTTISVLLLGWAERHYSAGFARGV